ncbi:hypothetical protein BDV3_006552 [Batrachochytrium dendrobatidis]|uniref:Elongation factor-like 1 n=2 Tax=Batrachochytrium dendrobatidis (strain JEL423) TaxID=403673 RepID=A0A177WNA5_BATDL|nr:hypothetical protein BDEG_25173 [Batrachochytrium dendrobatidis JEL423]
MNPAVSSTNATISSRVAQLQTRPDCIRNICILAHVDHGKTTLSDGLLSSNGIISSKLSGKVRYLDSRPDEQERGITMKSSGVSLLFNVMQRVKCPSGNANEFETKTNEYLINLIDSPGHVDFSSEVSTASRLCDGGLVLVDVVEGVCTQTHTVLRQAWTDKVKPILVLNKIDRLITELKMTPSEAYTQLNQILEQVNAVLGSFYSEALMKDATKKYEAKAALGDNFDIDVGIDDATCDTDQVDAPDMDDSDIYFSPEKGNVIFASSLDGWAFRVSQFAQMYAAKLGVKESMLNKVIWGDFYLDSKAKKVIGRKKLCGRLLKPLFVQFVLDNIWAVYHAVIISHDREKIEKIVKTINVTILPRDLRSKDLKALAQNIMTQWLPLSKAVLLAVVQHIPSPAVAQADRLPQILYPDDATSAAAHLQTDTPSSGLSTPIQKLTTSMEQLQFATDREVLDKAVYACNASTDAPVVVYISKMFSVSRNSLPKLGKQSSIDPDTMLLRRQEIIRKSRALDREKAIAGIDDASLGLNNTMDKPTIFQLNSSHASSTNDSFSHLENDEVLVGFARIYSGTIRVGQTLNVLGPKYNPLFTDTNNSAYYSTATVERLFLMMGRDFEDLDCVPAGNVFGILGLQDHVLKNATVSSTLACPSMAGVKTDIKPIVRVALEPVDPTQMKQLVHGLDMLNRADPCVEVILESTGENVIVCAGELHLERCLRDLRERFSRIQIQASPPIVPFRETLSIFPRIVQQSVSIQPEDTVQAPSTLFNTESSMPLPIGTVMQETKNKMCGLKLRAVPLPPIVRDFLAKSVGRVQIIDAMKDAQKRGEALQEFELELKASMDHAIKEGDGVVSKVDWNQILQGIVCFGPKGIGSNILSCTAQTYSMNKWNQTSFKKDYGELKLDQTESTPTEWTSKNARTAEFENSFVSGFQLSAASGPLCAEPMSGVCFVIEDVQFMTASEQDEVTRHATLPGQILAMMRQAMKQSFLQWSPRLMLAMYSCNLQTPTDILGKVYGVLNRRHGRILSEDLKEGTPFFEIMSDMPVVESFGFTDELRTRTSGAASPQLMFTGFQVLDQDPFWVPTTDEELEDLGEKADRDNLAKKYMDAVRKRKGMFTEKKVVEHAEKQKTLKNK